MRKINITIENDTISNEKAISLVSEVIDYGRIKHLGGAYYSPTLFKDGLVVAADKTQDSIDTFVVQKIVDNDQLSYIKKVGRYVEEDKK